jgi:beta-glucosidase
MLRLKKHGLALALVCLFTNQFLVKGTTASDKPALIPSDRNKALLAEMTLDEKIGQLNLQAGDKDRIGPFISKETEQAISNGQVGGILNVYGAIHTYELQKIATTQSRLKIPLLIGLDVVHGYRTIFPVPIGQAASFNPELIERAERVAADEATSAGINWTFGPVLDLGRDPRWGRMVETAGESPWYAAVLAKARIKGLQGGSLNSRDALMACAKHFAGNGATEGGREYTASDLSLRALRTAELLPFEHAINAGLLCVMPAFNAVDGVPGILNHRLLQTVLREEWKFDGMAVTDHGAIDELPRHGVAEDLSDAALRALKAGIDMDMASQAYSSSLNQLVKSGQIDIALIDKAVLRVLAIKEALGLFDNPYARSDAAREQTTLDHADHKALAVKLAGESLVLLKNETNLLPLSAQGRLALIGPFALDRDNLMGPWEANGQHAKVVSIHEGFARIAPHMPLLTAQPNKDGIYEKKQIEAAIKVARKARHVLLVLGEKAIDSGEASSRAFPGLPVDQMALLKAIKKLNKPFTVLLIGGRPFIEPDLYKFTPALIHAWFPGSEGGEAIARLVLGMSEPVGRLPVSIPRSVGQIPITHDKRPTGRPSLGPPEAFMSGYIDEFSTPLYPFGFGLSYTRFDYSDPVVIQTGDPKLRQYRVTIKIRNTGNRHGETLVQLYTRQRVAPLSQPEKQLRGFTRLSLNAGEEKDATIELDGNDLDFWLTDTQKAKASGWIDIMTGPDAADTKTTRLLLPQTQ